MIRLMMTSDSVVDTALGWRDQLAARVAGAFSLVYLMAAPVVGLTLDDAAVRIAMVSISLACAACAGLPLLLGWPTGGLRAWLLLGPAVLSALAGFAMLGFLSGPAVLLTLTLVTGGLLLGRGGLLTLFGIALAGLLLIAWGISNGRLPVPDPRHVALTSMSTWLRTITVTCLAMFVLGTVIVDIVSRLDSSLHKLRAETARREEAERARANAEIAAHEAKQLEAVGRLAAGIAHDFNNSLTAIIGCAELLRMTVPTSTRAEELTGAIIESSQQAAALTRQLLAYARKAQMVLKPVDLHQLLSGVLILLRGSLPAGITVHLDLCATRSFIQADAALLQNAIVNLLVNARDAMPEGGVLTLSTSDHEINDGSDALRNELAIGRYVLLEVIDTGTGIDPALLPKIFEPFFTTKAVGKGTGLGLAAVAGTVRAHAGAIAAESELGTGTAFRILLPQCKAQGAIAEDGASQIMRGRGHLLLVDDDMIVRTSAEATISMFGYRVTAVESGARALELLRSARETFDLMVLDLCMPTLSGAETFARVHELAPKLPVLIWSGYGAEDEVRRLLQQGAVGFVQKPYAVGELSRTLAHLTTAHAPRQGAGPGHDAAPGWPVCTCGAACQHLSPCPLSTDLPPSS